MNKLLNNRYQMTAPLGKGGFGITFMAEDTFLPSRRPCVIKQLRPATQNPEVYEEIKRRFEREAAILEDLSNGTNFIPKLYAYFTEDNKFYLVQELIEGINLEQKVRKEGVLPPSEVVQILIDVLGILEYIHKKGIIHRDIKPPNIMIRQADRKPVLIDFGAVKEVLGHGTSAASMVIGSLGYMPMEQGMGRPIFSSDLYSLAMTALHLLTGREPQDFNSDPQSGKILWRDQFPDLSSSLVETLDKALEPYPRDRFASAEAMLSSLGDLQLDMLTDQMKRLRRRGTPPT
ncbi:serine/threonine protein kinase [Gloeomargarita lithophora Alchichica-D10]|uniref:non-specific serine/threonine protein kinase n=1 Tax=Gloeomargarita lithophora Alchichica-D10 TaxID=1188229 RepID=A0A1J0AG06_9CYAN|nr:serine/threonine-protein kinase [Gloeomargarita lithophora]APB34853.1 serine/threonine protein kinase [Gloeomargarita lithophora Alchichica-D10]